MTSNLPTQHNPSLTDENIRELEIRKPTTPIQLALDVFNKNEDHGITINNSKSDIGYRRSNRLISVSKMSLEAKRLFDVMFYLAAQNIEENSVYKEYVIKDSKGFYSIDLGFMKWLLQLQNPRNDRLRKLLKDVQKISYQFEELNLDTIDSKEPLEWASYVVFPSLTMSIARQRVSFQINSLFEEVLKNTHKYQNHHFLSLCHIMPNLPSKLMYDWILCLDDQSDKFSLTMSVDQFRESLNLKKTKIYQDFNELNRRFLNPALEGINKNTNLSVNFAPLRKGSTSRITHLTFSINRTETQQSEHQKLLRFMQQYRELQTTFGLQASHFEEIQKNKELWTDAHINQAKMYVLLQLKKGIKIKSVAAYLMDALRKGYQAGELELALMQGETQAVQKIINKELNLNTESTSLKLENDAPLPDTSPNAETPQNNPKSASNGSGKDHYKKQAEQGWALFEKIEPFLQMEYIEQFGSNAYTCFILQAENLTADDPDSLFQIVLTHTRIKDAFGVFVYKKQDSQKN